MSTRKPEILDGQSTIAIIGVGAKMPGALSGPRFWENIRNGVYAIDDVPVDRWDPSLYWDPDPNAPDKTYSKIGGWVRDFEFDRRAFRLPPMVVDKTDPTQLLCLEAVREAMQDAGYMERDFDRDRCAVILGNALGGDLRDQTNLRIQYAELDAALRTSLLEASTGRLSDQEIEKLLDTVEEQVKSNITSINEDSMPGELANIIAGRVAQSFDLRGPNYVCDAACASTLAALESAVHGLRAGHFDMAVTGGSDRSMGPPSYVKFCKIGALSPDGSRPFDADANGFVMGEGAGILILKRLADAIDDGDQIYGLIRGIGGSSDGRGKGITAPNPRGQQHAIRRAYHDAGVNPRSVTLVEAHGTSTPVGDPAEVESLRVVFDEDDAPIEPGAIGLGSVKSMIGHLKSAAAAAGLVKVAYALRDRVLPPTINVETPNPRLELDGTPFRLQTETQEWRSNGAPRRAGVSAFGFGGTNFHVVLEEYDPEGDLGQKKWSGSDVQSSNWGRTTTAQAAPPDSGIIAFAADSVDALQRQFGAFADALESDGLEATRDHLVPLDGSAPPVGDVRLSVAFADEEQLRERTGRTTRALERRKGWRVLANKGVFFSEEPLDGEIAMLFPGQGTQYLGMLADLRDRFPAVEETLREADRIMTPVLGEPLTDILYPADDVDESEAFTKLSQTEITQPAVLTADIALLRTLRSLGIDPAMVAGHSLGEYGACVAAGVMTFEEALRTVARRGTEMAKATPMNGDPGLMAGVSMSVDEVQEVLDTIDGYVVCANKNCSQQTIIAGLTEPVEEAIAKFEADDHSVVVLPVSHAFHSKVVAAASEPLRRHLDTIDVKSPHTPILTNVTGDFYPQGPGVEDDIRDLLSKQVAAPVEFISLVERMYESGARVFVEVGPKRAQTSFVNDILEGRPHAALYSNHPKKGDIGSLFEALAQLWAVGAWEGEQTVAVIDTEADVAAHDSGAAPANGTDRGEALDLMIEILCEKTGYDPDEIEPDFELEADLGIDTVKQAEIMSTVREHYSLPKDDEFRLAEYPTLERLADYVIEQTGDHSPAVNPTASADDAAAVPLPRSGGGADGGGGPASTDDAAAVSLPQSGGGAEGGGGRREALDLMIEILCEKTGYDPDEIEPDFELEADLGIDTVKQAEIMSTVREHYSLPKDDGFRLAEYPTLERLADYVIEQTGDHSPAASPASADDATAVPLPRSGGGAEGGGGPASADDATAVPLPRSGGGAEGGGGPDDGRREALDLMIEILCEKTGYDPDEIEPEFELEADLGIDTVKQAEIMSTVREHYSLPKDDEFRLAEYPTLERLADYVIEQTGGRRPAVEPSASTDDETAVPLPRSGGGAEGGGGPASADDAADVPLPRSRGGRRHDWEHPHDVPADVVISGASLGLPGIEEFFSEDAVDALLGGENMIGDIAEDDRRAMATKRITRLIKREDGTGEMVDVDDPADVLKLAGRIGGFDLEEFDIPDRLVKAMDKTSQLAFAAGLLALKDAGLPLVPKYRTTTTGKKLTTGWTLPREVGDETGIILASAFAGQDALVDELTRSLTDEDYEFDHRFLLQILGIANSRFAEYVGARGPNTKINNACASTTTAVALAQDWIRAGRCERVVILGADNASGDELMEWIGSGFLATGAATTEGDVTQAALPFDRRRNGIIIGMGAVGLVVERGGLPEARGIEPIADVLATRFVNSALHPTRLDVDHIAGEVGELMTDAEQQFGLDRHDIAKKTVFVSHETYSPARGGSAQTEIESLRRTFGDDANDVVIANTKGFTGHAMGAGIEDVLAIKAMQREHLPHIANFEEPDPELGDLRLSEGGEYELDYALRLAAGFGSQLALALLRFRARDEDRLAAPDRYDSWLKQISGFDNPDLQVEHRTLRLREGDPKQTRPTDQLEQAAAPTTETQTELPQSVRRTPIRGTTVVADPGDGTFERLGVVVEAHAADGYDLTTLRDELQHKRVAVIAGPMVVTELVVRALERCGASVLVVEGREQRNPLDVDVAVCDLTDEAAITREMSNFGPVDGVVNLLGFGAERFGSSDVYRAARHSFHVARAWRHALGETPGHGRFFATITGMGGRLGFDRAAGPLPVCGAVAGFTKALSREWEDAKIRVVDVARTGFDPNLGLQALHEALHGTGAEIGLIGGVRYIPSTVRAEEITPETLPSMAPDADDVLIVTGGAKGITAEVAFDLATRYGCNLALVGRTALTHDDPLGVDMNEEKSRVREELEGSGERVTPVMVRDALAGLRSQRTIAENMERMRAEGSDVAYFSCDVSDEASVESMVDEVYERFGRINGVIHGAGVEESRLIEDKDVAGFDRVFRGKALGALHLWSAVERHAPTFYVAFSSVAGRFGNPGQVDYSAANEVLNKLVALLNATGKVRATSIDWTAWDEVGMAADGGMRTLLEARGVELLPPSIGAPMVGDFLEAGMAGEFVVAGALGDFARDDDVESAPKTPRAPLISNVAECTENRAVVTRTIDVDQDRFARDHVYEGTPIVPGVMGFEMMVEAASLLANEPASVVRNVQFERAIKLHHGEPIELEATAERNGRAVNVTVRTRRTARTGRELVSEHYHATVGFGETTTSHSFELDPDADLREGPTRETIYERYFHEGTFQVLDEVPWLGEGFAVGIGRLPGARLTAGFDNEAFITDPMVREMAFQTAGLWGMATNGMSYLPWSIGRAEHFRSATPGQDVCVRCLRRDDADEHMIAFDVEVLGPGGELLQRMERVQLVGHRKLTDEEQFEPFAPHRVRTRRLDAPTAERILDRVGIEFDDLVDAEEREAYDRLISERRKGEWYAARVAAKTLVAEYARDFHGVVLSPADVRIRKDEYKAPYLVVEGRDDVGLPAISISHSGGVSIAGITAGEEHAVGIDLEAIEQRDDAFARNYFSRDELGLACPGDDATRLAVLWATKEAVSKALGIGLHARLDEMEVTALRTEDGVLVAEVDLRGMALDAWNDHHASDLDVRIAVESDRVLATAVMQADTTSERATVEMEKAPRPDQDQQIELAAIAALFKHRGLVGPSEAASETDRTDLPSWKAEP